jgi:molybdopterin-guanine dinucleotide biosynthesis protein A
MKPIPVYLLAGGRSSRFGSDKARAELAGVPLILRLAHQVEPVASPLVVVADRRDKYLDLGLTTIADALPGLGPLGGLLTACGRSGWRSSNGTLMNARRRWCFAIRSGNRFRVSITHRF